MCVPNIADRNLPYNLRICLKLCHQAKLEMTELLNSVADLEGCSLEHALPSPNAQNSRKKLLKHPGSYPLIYTSRIGINICILKIRVLMSKSLKYIRGKLVLSESLQNHVVHCEEMRFCKISGLNVKPKNGESKFSLKMTVKWEDKVLKCGKC